MADDKARPISLQEERRLVERLQQGDSSALAPLWHAHARTLYSTTIYPRLPVAELAEEVLQNTFLKAYERIGKYTWQERGILPWLKTIARNMTMDVHRRHQRTEHFCQGYGQHMETAQEAQNHGQRPDAQLDARQERVLAKERVAAVLASGKLNERYRRVIELRLFEELDRDACAQIMDVKVGTLDVLFHRALKRFENVYRQLYGTWP